MSDQILDQVLKRGEDDESSFQKAEESVRTQATSQQESWDRLGLEKIKRAENYQ
jgi:hypothetical protein